MGSDLQLGIGVGIALAGLSSLGIAWLFRLRRVRRQGLHGRRRSDASDLVTGLPSRAVFEERAIGLMEAAEAEARVGCALYAGLDGFRLVNDRHGHQAGDDLLRHVGDRLQELIGARNLLCRVAGDEFALWLDMPLEQAKDVAERIVALFKDPLVVQGHEHAVGISVGIAVFPEHGARTRIMAHAAAAMRTVKLEGGNAHAVFSPQMAAAQREEIQLVRDLRQAVARRELELFYQPKIDAGSLQVTAAEALLRWKHPTRGVVTPDLFIPLAERHGLIGEIGNWVLDETLAQAAVWRQAGLRMRVAINVSGYQMRQDDFVVRLERGLKSHGLQASRFTCEITESVAMEDTAVTQRAFERLGKLGVHVSIDDFGTGHSSLAALRRLPAGELKIDRAFVADVADSNDVRTIVQAIVQMAHTLRLRVVAEGVETVAQRDQLLALGCDELQGYLFAKPMSARALGLWAMDAPATLSQAFRASLFKETQAYASRARVSTQVMSTRP